MTRFHRARYNLRIINQLTLIKKNMNSQTPNSFQLTPTYSCKKCYNFSPGPTKLPKQVNNKIVTQAKRNWIQG